MICLPEVPFNVDRFVEKVERMQKEKPSIVIAVSEGVKLADGRYVCELADDVHAVDAFGHKALTGTARFWPTPLPAVWTPRPAALSFPPCSAALAT